MDSIPLSPLALFMQAGAVGKIVMALLLGASIWCWVLIVEGYVLVAVLRRALRGAQTAKGEAALDVIRNAGAAAASLIIDGETVGERRLRITEAMQRAGAMLFARAESGLPSLSVISSVAPFIGLLGTVWGIMGSFAGIAEAKDTSLAVVAPGIAEALAATAYGLAAAIPASIGYNKLSAALATIGQQFSHLIEAKAVDLLINSKGAT